MKLIQSRARKPLASKHAIRRTLEALEDRTVPTAVAVPSDQVSWWSGGNTAADVMGAHNGTLVGGTTYAQGEVGQAFSFDGINDTVVLPGTFGGGPEATIEAWVKTTGTTGDFQAIVEATDANFVHLQFGTNGSNVAYTDAGIVSLPILLPSPVDVYQHIAISIKSGDSRLYVNGSLIGTSTKTFSTILPTSNLRIGSGYQGGRFFKGGIDEISYFNRALTPGEVQGIYNAGSDGKVFSPIAVDFPSVIEGSTGTTTPVPFTIQRTGGLSGSLTVAYATADGSATAGSDYVAVSGYVTFADGEATKTVQVTVNGDNAPEPDETFKLVLTPAGQTPIMGLASIVNDDIGISVNNVTVTEGNPHFGSLGALVDQAANGGLALSTGMVFGPDGNLYVGSLNSNEVLRYSATTGAFLGAFVTSGSGGLSGPAVDGLSFRPDGKLYVASRNSSSVLRYDATTGAFLDTFVPSNSGGLLHPKGMAFGPDGNLYISSATNQVLRYNGTTGAFLGVFVAAGSGGLSNPRCLTFRPDGNLYVSSTSTNSVLRYNGTTGAFLSTFIPAGSGGLNFTGDFLFTNGSVYVASQNTSQVLRYDATTGAFIEVAVSANSNGLDQPIGLLLDANNNLLVGSNAAILRYGPASQAAFTVSLITASGSPVAVDYSTANGTALAGSDYVAVSGTLTFAPGETTKTVVVPTLVDSVAEGDEMFTVNLSNPVGATITAGQGVATTTDDDVTKFYVVNDGSPDQTYRYGAPGNTLGNSALNSGNTAPRGAASTAAGTTVWVADANGRIYVYNPSGGLLGSWTAGGLPANAQVEGIATNGTDVWLADAKQDKVFKYIGAASRLSGSQNAASSFNLASADSNAKGIVTDGTSFWVVDDGSSNKVFKYTLAGSSLGNWTIDAANASPTGLTINPANVSDIWIVDNGTGKVYRYAAAAGRTSGSQSAVATFALATGNTNPQDIADPPSLSISDATATEGSQQFAILGTFTANGNLDNTTGMAWGPDGNLYVGSLNTNQVLRFDKTTGDFLGTFIAAGTGGFDSPAVQGLNFRPDGKLYVLSRNAVNVLRFDATTGDFLDVFIPSGSGGLQLAAKGMTVGPDGNWYVSSGGSNQSVLRYSGTTGAFLGAFVPAGSGGLNVPRGLTFGPDGNLYVASSSSNSVLRYNGQTGAFIDTFIPSGSGGLIMTGEVLFHNSSLYVSSQGSNEILRYDGQTGVFLGKVAVPAGPNGISQPIGLLVDSNNNLLVGCNSAILRYGPASQAAFTVSLDSASVTPVTVNYSTANGTAIAGSDYVTASGTITFALGETTRTILVRTLDDTLSESTETFSINLSNPTGATIADGQAVGTIADNEPQLLQIASSAINAGAAQRSRVTEITITFNAVATLPPNRADAFRLARTGPGGPTGNVELAVDLSGSTASRTVARLTFSGPLTEFGSLIDGLYRLTVLSNQASGSGQPLDGDANGAAGGDFTLDLHRLYGDVNGDKAVNGLDFAAFRAAFGANPVEPSLLAAFDANGDGAVNGLDFAAFRGRFGQLPLP